MNDIATELKEVLGSTGGGYLRDEQVSVVMRAATQLIKLQRIVDSVQSKTALDIVADKMAAEDELARIVKIITNCRETAELQASPDGPSGDVTNLLAKLGNCERQAGYLQESVAEWSAAARGHCDTIEEKDKTIASLMAEIEILRPQAHPSFWAVQLLERDDVQGRKVLERMIAYYEENDGKADDFGRLFIVIDANIALGRES